MPSWPIHLALASKLDKKLNLGDEFILGNVLPDVLGKNMIKGHSQTIDKYISHFQKGRKINIDLFVSKYKNNFNNPIVCGFLSHLVADKYFNDYFYINHISEKNGIRKIILKDGSLHNAEKTWYIKRRDFERFGQKLVNDGLVPSLDISKINKKDLIIDEVPINDSDLEKTALKIEEIKKRDNKYNCADFEAFTEDSLTLVFDNCYKEILDILKTLN